MPSPYARIVAALCCLAALVSAAGAPTPERPAVHVYVFASEGCPACERLHEILKGYPDELRCDIIVHDHWVDDLEEYMLLVELEKGIGERADDLPAVVIGDRIFSFEDDDTELRQVIEDAIAAGGAPEIEMPEEGATGRAGESLPAGTPMIRIAYFERAGCSACARAGRAIQLAQSLNPAVSVRTFSTQQREERLRLEALCERAGVPEDRRLVVPAVFVGTDALIDDGITDAALANAVARYAGSGTGPTWEVSEAELAAARGRLIARFRKVGLLAVVVGGLIDGINPCAFATLVFFVGYLTVLGRGGRDILVVGAAFAAGVYVAYFATGLGLSELLARAGSLPTLGLWLRWGLIIMAFTLAVLSLRDFVLARRGRTDDMALSLPKPLRRRINALIARRLRTGTIAVSAGILGLAVSLLELACTGQVYLPLLQFMNSVSVDRWRTAGLLAVYNLAFIAPLVAIFTAASLGLSSERLMAFLKSHVAWLKLAMALFFIALGLLLIHFG